MHVNSMYEVYLMAFFMSKNSISVTFYTGPPKSNGRMQLIRL